MAPLWNGMAAGLLLSAAVVSGQANSRLGASPSYQGFSNICPEQCIVTGPEPSNWSTYNDMNRLANCNQAMLYGFNLYDDVDDADSYHRIFACTAYGNDWSDDSQSHVTNSRPEKEHKVNYEIGWSSYSPGTESDYRSLIRQMRDYVARGHVSPSKTAMLYAQFGYTSAGIYIGNSLQSKDIGDVALQSLIDDSHDFDGRRDSLTMQLCGPHYDSQHVFGFMALRNGTFRAIQSAFKSWSNAECLDFEHSTNFTASTHFTSSMLSSIKAGNMTTSGIQAGGSALPANLSTQHTKNLMSSTGECRTQKVQNGDSCAAIATRCGISGADFTKYNSEKGFCSKLKPGQHVCCSSGTLPDFSPKPKEDGSCATTTVGDGESCSTIAAANSLTEKDIDGFNQKTWGWGGCKNIFKDSVICISKGSPPMPAEVSDAECGPQVPGTKLPKDMSKLADLNPCPLNACCNTFGHCGTTAEFCTDTNTGAPGTAKAGTNGCISHCGMDIVKGNAPTKFRSVGYYESYQFKRQCLYQDVMQVDHSKYTHLHFGFVDISSDYEISINDKSANYQFHNFKYISGPKRIVSFGGWDFSTQASTYQIFRQGTSAANRKKLATNIANFVKENNLDGVDIDWEYPSAPDIPGVPSGDKSEGNNYLEFLIVLKNLLGDKSVSIAAPGSYWYLKGFPIAKISKVIDYIVFMTYDLHGQWDAGNPNAQPGCDDGSCLRSHVNMTETKESLSLITKAGVDSGKVVVGVSSYGRSFRMVDADCDGPMCKFTGTRLHSNAEKADCTDTAGYISNAEINQLLDHNSSRVNKHYVDTHSNSNIMVYDNTNWVAYMSPEIRAERTKMYQSLGMGGTVNWATDLEKFNDAPEGVEIGLYSRETPYWSPMTRWRQLDAAGAWSDLIADWKNYRDKDHTVDKLSFSAQISYLLGGPDNVKCGQIDGDSNCPLISCKLFNIGNGTKSGAAAELIWDSFFKIHQMYAKFKSALVTDAALVIDNTLPHLENTFAPVPPPEDNAWLDMVLDFVSMGVPMVGGKFIDDFLKMIPAMTTKSDISLDHYKEVLSAILDSPATIATNLKGTSDPNDWTPEKQAEFSKYMGQSLQGWNYIFTKDLENLFDGTDKSIERLTIMISDGRMIDGIPKDIPYPDKTKRKDKDDDDNKKTEATDSEKKSVEDGFLTAFWAYSIPAVWQASGHHPFIIDTGRSCDDKDGDKYTKDLKSIAPCDYDCGITGGCKCDDSAFSSLKGVEELDGKAWSGLKVEDIIIGSVRTYKQNGNENGGGMADPTDSGTFEALKQMDITTPGFMRLPVCSETLARTSWENADKTEATRNKDGFPCNNDNGRSYCTTSESTYIEETTSGSPLIDDCLVIVKNIEGTTGSWNKLIEIQYGIAHFGTCTFGIEGKGRHGNSNVYIGAQDIVDIIRYTSKHWGHGTDKMQGKGVMQCNGNIKQQELHWAIYKK
ncbi:Peptidoglycan-binding Lysin subgroup [Penicillium expansum]|nr:Peptidoglycan-binding Lysin subgroup [Penicillium expansum]